MSSSLSIEDFKQISSVWAKCRKWQDIGPSWRVTNLFTPTRELVSQRVIFGSRSTMQH